MARKSTLPLDKNLIRSTDMGRRNVLLSAAGAASLAYFRKVHGMEEARLPGAVNARSSEDLGATTTAKRSVGFVKDHDLSEVSRSAHLHEGKGAIDVKYFFWEEKASRPALILIYTIPPGASEGVHVHKPGNEKLGSFDEFYYILSGSGAMEIDGEKVPVKSGDHVFTPNGVPHGIENTSVEGDLKVYLLAMIRD